MPRANCIPFNFPREKSPGGREWDYHSNAESFLIIGESMGKAMGKAMVEMQKSEGRPVIHFPIENPLAAAAADFLKRIG